MIHVERREALPSLPLLVPIHQKALTEHPAYRALGVTRIPIPADKISWSAPWPEYGSVPQERFDHPAVLNEYASKGAAGWAASPSARALVGETKSYVKELPSTPEGEVLNPGGRTGIREGRGLLGRPGPNFAADPLVFRISPQSGKLQILLIQRKDTGEWALPGGMTDFGEWSTRTLQRELQEETGLVLTMDDAIVVYQGYVDDPRNTDKAWIETVAAFKLLTANEALCSDVEAGDDAMRATWRDLDPEIFSKLYASHAHLIQLALEQLPLFFGEQLVGVRDQVKAIRTP